jgi:hypothetical protein
MKTVIKCLIVLAVLLTAGIVQANVDNPNGCKPANLYGGVASFHVYDAAAAQTIREGDPVKLDHEGRVAIATATDSVLLGFARTAVTASTAGDDIYVYDDPNEIFQCQCSAAFKISMVGHEVDLEGTTGIYEVNAYSSIYKPVRIVGWNINDTVGDNTRVYVQVTMHVLGMGDTLVCDDAEVFDDLTVAGDATVTGTLGGGTVTDGTISISAGTLTGGVSLAAVTVTGTTLTDGVLSSTGGIVTGAGSVTSTVLEDGAGGSITGGTVTGVTVTDGTCTSTSGTVTGCASITSTKIDDGAGGGITGGTVTGNTLTDGNFSVTAGTITGAVDVTMTGDLSVGGHRLGLRVQAQPCIGTPGGAEWVPWGDGAGAFGLCHCPASIAAEYALLPCQVSAGDEIVGATVSGYCTEIAALTLDADLVRCSRATGACTVLATAAGFPQVTACGAAFDSGWTLTAVETVNDDNIYGIRVLGTTGIGDTIDVASAFCVANVK